MCQKVIKTMLYPRDTKAIISKLHKRKETSHACQKETSQDSEIKAAVGVGNAWIPSARRSFGYCRKINRL